MSRAAAAVVGEEVVVAGVDGLADDEWFAEDRAAADAFVTGRADAELFVDLGGVAVGTAAAMARVGEGL